MKIKKPRGTVRPLDPDDPRNLDHPCHRQQWLELARAIGRSMATEQFAKDRAGKGDKKPKPKP
jgi:hypothetical protein